MSNGYVASGAEFLVNSETTGGQYHPAITDLAGGGFVVAWITNDITMDGDSYAVKAQVFNLDTLSTPGDDRLTGTREDDAIHALSGDDRARGLAGNDILIGGRGNDTLDGGAGDDLLKGRNDDDTLTGGTGKDRFVYLDQFEGADTITDFTQGEDVIALMQAGVTGLAALGIDTTSSPGDTILSFGTTQITLQGFAGTLAEADFTFLQEEATGSRNVLFGNRHANNLVGHSGHDKIFGRRGADTIDGGAGNDRLVGGRGNDILYGSSGNDKLFGNQGADSLDGSSGDDHLMGGLGNDILYGSSGNDRLIGGPGTDLLTGGSGADEFRFFGQLVTDVITDFQPRLDTLNLRGTGVEDFVLDVAQSDVGDDRVLIWSDGADSHRLVLEGLAGTEIDAGDVLF